MLRKRSRSHPKAQTMISGADSESYFHPDVLTQRQKTSSFLKTPGLFVGFDPRSSDADSVRSPTSPLDLRIFSGFGNPFRHHRPRSQNESQQKSWSAAKVGLSIIDSLDDETKELGGKAIWASGNKNIILKRQLSVRTLDSEKHRSYLTDFGTHKSRLGSGLVLENSKNLTGENNASGGKLSSVLAPVSPVLVSAIVDSEDYTCVRTHGSNPKVTHIFGDQILECLNDEVKIEDDDKTPEAGFQSSDDVLVSYQPNSFLKFCYSCKKGLDGEDIYMYRGEKAFCSSGCRACEIEKEEMEKTNYDSSGTFDCSSVEPELTSKGCLFVAT